MSTTNGETLNHDSVRTLTIDIGGTGIKMLRVDQRGQPLSERARMLTPKPASPSAVLDTIREMLTQQDSYDRASVGFPGVIVRGIVRTAPNLGTDAWQDFDLQRAIGEITRRPTRVLNDADLQGYGAIRGVGVELVLTLGTGLGTALFVDGRLVPNLEIAHHRFKKGVTYEHMVANATLERIGRKKWSEHVWSIVEKLEPVFNYETLHIGGGNAKKLKGPPPPRVRVFESTEGLAGGVMMWLDGSLAIDVVSA